jgi:hypothetical protein
MGVWGKNGSGAKELSLVNLSDISRVSGSTSLMRSLSWKQF